MRSTSRIRNIWKGSYHSRSQCVCGTRWTTARSVVTRLRPRSSMPRAARRCAAMAPLARDDVGSPRGHAGAAGSRPSTTRSWKASSSLLERLLDRRPDLVPPAADLRRRDATARSADGAGTATGTRARRWPPRTPRGPPRGRPGSRGESASGPRRAPSDGRDPVSSTEGGQAPSGHVHVPSIAVGSPANARTSASSWTMLPSRMSV